LVPSIGAILITHLAAGTNREVDPPDRPSGTGLASISEITGCAPFCAGTHSSSCVRDRDCCRSPSRALVANVEQRAVLRCGGLFAAKDGQRINSGYRKELVREGRGDCASSIAPADHARRNQARVEFDVVATPRFLKRRSPPPILRLHAASLLGARRTTRVTSHSMSPDSIRRSQCVA
jgi:hypothetical protein